jgi:hypothetical protein
LFFFFFPSWMHMQMQLGAIEGEFKLGEVLDASLVGLL